MTIKEESTTKSAKTDKRFFLVESKKSKHLFRNFIFTLQFGLLKEIISNSSPDQQNINRRISSTYIYIRGLQFLVFNEI